MIALPLVAAVVATVFAAMLGAQYARRRRPFQLLWTLALFMYAAASLALFLGQLGNWTGAEFRTYWLLGAVLNVPYLAGGEVALLFPRRPVVAATFLVLFAATVFAARVVAGAPIETGPLTEGLPRGREVFGHGSGPHLLAQYFGWGGYLLLLAGTLWSSFQIRGVAAQRDRFYGTLLIAAGATVVAIGTGVGAALASFAFFSLALAGGIVVMFLGFLRAAGRRPAGPVPA